MIISVAIYNKTLSLVRKRFELIAMTFDFLIINSTWLGSDIPRLSSCGTYIFQLVRFARCCTSVIDSNFQITSK